MSFIFFQLDYGKKNLVEMEKITNSHFIKNYNKPVFLLICKKLSLR